MDVLTADGICHEVSRSATALRYKLDLDTVKQVWKELSLYVSNSLKMHKGVLLPSLGYFSVGSSKGDKFTIRHKVRASFTLQEGRFTGVPQETPKYHLTGTGAVLQPNYNVIGATLPLHRSVVQHIVKQLLQRVALHIAAGHFAQLDFPTLGRLVTNRAGRLEFQFELALLEVLDSGVQQRLQQYRLADAALREYDSERPTTAGSRSLSAPRSRGKTPPPSRRSRVILDDDLIERDAEIIAFDYVRQLCRESDRVGSGFVDRLQLEQWLHQRCRALLAQIDTLAFLDLLYAHTHGSAGRFIRYNVFLDSLLYHTQLKALPEPQEEDPELHPPSPKPMPLPAAAAQRPALNPAGIAPPAPTSAAASAPSAPQIHPFDLPPPVPPHVPPHLPQYSQYPPQQPPQYPLQQPPQQPPQQRPQQPPQQPNAPPLPHSVSPRQHPAPNHTPYPSHPLQHPSPPWGAYPDQDPSPPKDHRHQTERLALHSAASSARASQAPDFHLLDYYKQRSSHTPVSRSECDDFNRYHFTRLFDARGSLHGLAPKVQQDPLNMEDADVVTPRVTPRAGSASGTSMVVQTGANY